MCRLYKVCNRVDEHVYNVTAKVKSFNTIARFKCSELVEKPFIIRRLNNTVLNDIPSMYHTGVCTAGAIVWVQ